MDRESARDRALEEAKDDLRSTEDRSTHISKALKQLENVEESIALQSESFRDWYSLHFPELCQRVQDDAELLELLEQGVRRKEIDAFQATAADSNGSEISPAEEKVLEDTVESLGRIIDTRERLRSYIIEQTESLAPNLSALLEPILASKLISLAGSLKELSKQPASTIQTLGAEKALFRYLSGNGSPPKHGVLFEHEYVSQLPEDERGKMARFLANKSAIAARLDQYGDKEKGEELRSKAEEKFEDLR